MAVGLTKERTIHIIDTLFQQLLAVFVLLVLWEVFKYYSSYEAKHVWHVVLCTLGIALCMAEGLLLFNRENSFLKDVDRLQRGTIHGIVMLLAFLCVTIGVALKIDQKVAASAQHFTTTHGLLGLITWILTIISVLLGVVAANITRCSSSARPGLFKIIHLFIGVAGYVIGAVTVGFGLHYLEWTTGVPGRNALIVFLALYVAYSLIGSLKSCYNYFVG